MQNRMAERTKKILLVEPEADILELLVSSLVRRFDAHITCVSDTESCLDIDMLDPHDLVITELHLEKSDGLSLTSKLKGLSDRPVIVLADEPTCDEVVTALRLGVHNLFRKPFPIEQLLESAGEAINQYALRRKQLVKHRRMRELVRKVIRERRELNARMQLICQDLVGAHRNLVHRVLSMEDPGSPEG